MLKAQDADHPRRPGKQLRVAGNAFAFAPARAIQGHSFNPKFGASHVARANGTAWTCAWAPPRDNSMANKMLIDTTHPEETRVVVLRGNRVEEFDFEVREPPPAARQHLSRQGHAGRAFAPGRLRRLRRQPPRLPGVLGNPSRLLSDPGRRPAGADRRAKSARIATPRKRSTGAPAGGRRRAATHSQDAATRCARSRSKSARWRERHAETRDEHAASADDDAAEHHDRPSTSAEATKPQRRRSVAHGRAGCASGRTAGRSIRAAGRDAPASESSAESRRRAERSRPAQARRRDRDSRTPPRAPISRPNRTATETADGGNITEIEEPAAAENGDEEVVESVGGADAMEEVQERTPRYRRSVQDPGSHQAPADHAGAGRQGRARHQGRGAHHLPLARRPLFGADAEHRARRRHLAQDHQRGRPQEAQGDRAGPRSAGGHGRHPAHRGRHAHQDRGEARLRISAAAVGDGARLHAQIDRADAGLRGRLADQALDPRPLQQGHRGDPGRRRGRPSRSARTSCAC